MTQAELEAWEDAAAEAGDMATMLIAGIARGVPAPGLCQMSPGEIEAEWPQLLQDGGGKEIAMLCHHPARARRMVESWGSPYPDH